MNTSNKGADQSARMRTSRLVCALVVRTQPKTGFFAPRHKKRSSNFICIVFDLKPFIKVGKHVTCDVIFNVRVLRAQPYWKLYPYCGKLFRLFLCKTKLLKQATLL